MASLTQTAFVPVIDSRTGIALISFSLPVEIYAKIEDGMVIRLSFHSRGDGGEVYLDDVALRMVTIPELRVRTPIAVCRGEALAEVINEMREKGKLSEVMMALAVSFRQALADPVQTN